MGNITTALVFVITLNMLMYLAQASILNLNPSATMFFTNEGQILDQFDKNSGTGGEPVLDTENTYNNLPSGNARVEPTTGNIFTDIFSSIKNWFAEKLGITYLGQIVSAPYNFLKAMGLPSQFTFAIGSFWYGITFFLVVAFIMGRTD